MRTANLLLAVVAALCLASAVSGAPTARAQSSLEFLPGSTLAKTHEAVPLDCSFGGFVRFRCRADKPAIAAAPHTSQAGGRSDATGAGSFDFSLPDAIRDFLVIAPPGFTGNLTAVDQCDRSRFGASVDENPAVALPEAQCPISSQLGVATVRAGDGLVRTNPVFRLTPSAGYPASFGFKVLGETAEVVVNAEVRTDGDYGVTLRAENITSKFRLMDATTTIWGVPALPRHDVDRWNFFVPSSPPVADPSFLGDWGGSAGIAPVPLLQTPSDCGNGDLETVLRIRSWQDPGRWLPDSLPAGDPSRGDYVIPTPRPTGCDQLVFEPSIGLRPTDARADSATGAEVLVEFPQDEDPQGLSTPPLRRAVVTLPEDVTLNPAAADGLRGCTTGQIGLTTTTGAYPNPIRFARFVDEANRVAERCPDAAKVGTATVISPALDDPLPGDVYVAQPHDNPFGSLFAMYLVVRGPGFTAKLPGLIEVDEQTGRVTTTFDHSPQLPVESVELDLFGGSRASLVTPRTCGEKTTSAVMTPWSAPQSGPPATPESSFVVAGGAGGGPCAASLGARPFDVGFAAGSTNPIASTFTPFTVRLERPDGRQELDRVEVTTPPGVAADLSQVPYCPEGAIAQAIARDKSGDGAVERSNPSCPAASRVGSTTIGAGAGSNPYYVSGDVYLAGPYKGAPLSLVFVVPAIAGPFDLGVQVVRAAAHVDRKTAEVTTSSDTIPKILEGVPLRVRDVRVDIDRPGFAVTPSSCAEKRIAGQAHGSHGATTGLVERFQVADCASLRYNPRLAIQLTGRKQRRTGGHPGVKAVVRQTGLGEAGIRKAVTRLPKSLALDPDNAQALCEFEDGTRDDLENRCPKGSIVGRARAVSPLLKRPLAGNVYFVKNVRRDARTGNLIRTLPMIVVALRGEIAINLYGTSSVTEDARLVNTFASVPDAPISQFNLNIKGGKNGILAVTRTRRSTINLCAKPKSHIASATLNAQNGMRRNRNVRMKTPCKTQKGKNAKRKASKAPRGSRSATSAL